ncbi:MAG: tRNA (guanosine(46)-N7)-methyltransferase TrmB [Campylobacter sp.]|jgi:tRNA (guanine-N7-)-methyltransferase|uniref:tRNA (guanosine(46)-N7)-methyltransferase TrmB n=1 Tax=Campylobacter TaxID=194 RepID=UPI000A338CDF|nr:MULTISPECIES: tRNA (guanosine(46)-N7)-methyltransferase TrmB [unclassified Campylobacter]MBP3676066.1 tRNA (guanosine(46)-N7)-methyltransferase TrmB [Campylobacter sp.]MBR2148338.1 tRNA (guanosine(46)-N7)-methyltransferase TrmB [Campylobacter sp.]MBR2221445.1 tRNA (guanosine(46)-N7)-methyltransferase TrmB [Campylobacter sp.]
MPNIVAKNLKNVELPVKFNEVEFIWEAKSNDEKLVYTKALGCEFCLVVKDRGNSYVIKCDKLTRPAKLEAVQMALEAYKQLFASDVISQATAVKKPKNLESKYIINSDELLNRLEDCEYKRIFVEIGFGSGRHLLYQAKENPEALIIGIEVYKPACLQVENLAGINGLKNIVLLNLDARLVMSLLKSNSIDRLFLHFPVPWGKSKMRRVVSPQFALECQRTLKDGGTFELRSDDRDYTDFTIGCFMDLKNANIQIFKNRFLEISSKYEDRWIRQNKDIYDVICAFYGSSDELDLDFKFEFSGLELEYIKSNFANKTIKYSDHFIHLERIYILDNGDALVRVAFGSFYRPEHRYLLISRQNTIYLFKKPLLTPENIKAHNNLEDMLKCATL